MNFPDNILRPVLLTLILTAPLIGQTEKRVVFAKGKSSATMRGSLPRNYADYDSYIIRARRGQTLSVKLVTSDPSAYIQVFETKQLGPEEDLISATGGDYTRDWSGKLPITSEYSVQVYGVRESGGRSSRTAYTIEITIR